MKTAWSARCAWPPNLVSSCEQRSLPGLGQPPPPRQGDFGFAYRIGLLYLDLDEQAQLPALSRLAGRGRWSAFAFDERDYLPAATHQGTPLKSAVLDLLEQVLHHRPKGRCAY